jgi:hypothetical protein
VRSRPAFPEHLNALRTMLQGRLRRLAMEYSEDGTHHIPSLACANALVAWCGKYTSAPETLEGCLPRPRLERPGCREKAAGLSPALPWAQESVEFTVWAWVPSLCFGPCVVSCAFLTSCVYVQVQQARAMGQNKRLADSHPNAAFLPIGAALGCKSASLLFCAIALGCCTSAYTRLTAHRPKQEMAPTPSRGSLVQRCAGGSAPLCPCLLHLVRQVLQMRCQPLPNGEQLGQDCLLAARRQLLRWGSTQ